MTYYQFIHAVEEKIKKEVKEERKISVHTNIKNNGVKRTGIMISENGINISPTIYLEEYFQQVITLQKRLSTGIDSERYLIVV